jgi:hypothetical protein
MVRNDVNNEGTEGDGGGWLRCTEGWGWGGVRVESSGQE